MCNINCISFGEKNIKESEVRGKRVLEVGAVNVNGSLRKYVESYKPSAYVGVDIEQGVGVDLICDIVDLKSRFGKESFDVIICTEVMEHVENWRRAIHNLKIVLKTGGILVLTTRSEGFPLHGYPSDFWRYSLKDIVEIFSDFRIESLGEDFSEPGVFLKAVKPVDFKEKDLSTYELFSMDLSKNV